MSNGLPTKATGKKINQFRIITDKDLNNDALRWVVGDESGILYQPTIGQLKSMMGAKTPTFQAVLDYDSTLTKDNTIDSTGFTLRLLGDIQPTRIKDATGAGSAGQILSSTATGIQWVNAPSGGSGGWGLAGNAGTTSSNFIGTTDNVDLFIRTTNVNRLRVANTGQLDLLGNEVLRNGARFIFNDANSNIGIASTSFLSAVTTGSNNVGIGAGTLAGVVTGGYNVAIGPLAIGAAAGSQNIAIGWSSQAVSTSNFNIAVGVSTLKVHTTGDQNTAIGASVLSKDVTGTRNTGVGASALLNNTTGNNNTAVGKDALLNNTTGSENISVGYHTLSNNTTGSDNIAIGNNCAQNLNGGSGNLAIGNFPLELASNNGNNQMNIMGKFITNSDGTMLGVYKTGALANLDVQGTGAFSGTLKIGAYTLPNTDGTAGQVLQTNGAGVLTWQSITGYQLTGVQLQLSPTGGTTYYFGSHPNTTSTTQSRTYVPQSGTVIRAIAFFVNNGVGSAETSSVYVDINGAQTLLSSAVNNSLGTQVITNTSLNLPVVGNFTDYIRGVWITPASWATPPTNVRVYFMFWIKT